jgi:hypothetical protein
MLVAAHALPAMPQNKVTNLVKYNGGAHARDAQRKVEHVHFRYEIYAGAYLTDISRTCCNHWAHNLQWVDTLKQPSVKHAFVAYEPRTKTARINGHVKSVAETLPAEPHL